MRLLALTRSVPASIQNCELSFLTREPLDFARAVAEHDLYEAALVRLGCTVQRLPDAPDQPDSVFVEDTAVVFDELAVIARPGAVSRRSETEAMAGALTRYRRLVHIEAPGTLDGGDVLVTPGRVFVGISGRTNADGAHQLERLLAPHGFVVVTVPVAGCLHLKSAATLAAPTTMVISPDWVDATYFDGFDLIEVDRAEPAAANVLRIGGHILCAKEHVETRRRIEARGFVTVSVPAGELAKAEGGVTCCAVIVEIP
jgi:dimethylargininase